MREKKELPAIFKKIHADENELYNYLGLVDRALSGNLSSHAIMLFNLNRDLSEDMGNAAVFLCSEKANMITGVALEVDGGRCI